MADAPAQLSPNLLAELREAALDRTYVSLGGRRTSSVHEFYRYPARFSPALARAAINAFTTPGDTVLDPFGGGGTTAVEAQLLDRRCVIADINSLATFVTEAKTKLYAESDLSEVEGLAERLLSSRLTTKGIHPIDELWQEAGYWRNVDTRETWRLRSVLEQALVEVPSLGPSAELLARCALLRSGQWALDMRQHLPDVASFRQQLYSDMTAMCQTAREHRRNVLDNPLSHSEPTILNQGLPESSTSDLVVAACPPDLLLTSPPYPGVYVNYHRWKVRGRKESPAPYWVADRLDGNGISHYTMSARNSLDIYFDKLQQHFAAIATIVSEKTWLVQVVGFGNVDSQLSRYLDVMASSGFKEYKLDDLGNADDGRLWRAVPSRRWWVSARQKTGTAVSTSQEVLLVHRLS